MPNKPLVIPFGASLVRLDPREEQLVREVAAEVVAGAASPRMIIPFGGLVELVPAGEDGCLREESPDGTAFIFRGRTTLDGNAEAQAIIVVTADLSAPALWANFLPGDVLRVVGSAELLDQTSMPHWLAQGMPRWLVIRDPIVYEEPGTFPAEGD